MRGDPERLRFEITAGDGAARTGRLQTCHGPIATPAFIPLATRGAVRTLDVAEVAGLGFELILGNTFHLFLAPGAERIAALGGLHRFIGWERAMITDSGGFQVFSLAHGNVADEIKGRRRGAGAGGGVIEISERGVAFRSYIDGSQRLMGPEESMAVQAALGADIALAFDECTPYHADREYTARSTERTHRWLDRCLRWHSEHGPGSQAVFGIVQGGVHEDLRRESAAGGRRSRRRRDRDRGHARARQAGDAWGAGADRADAARRAPPSTCSGSESPTTCWPGSGSGSTSSTARSRPGSPGTGWRSRRCRIRGFDSTSRAPTSRPTRRRWSRAVGVRPARATVAPTCTISPGPRSRPPAGCSPCTT